MPIQGTGSVQEQSTPEQVLTPDTLRRRMVLLGLFRFASLRFASPLSLRFRLVLRRFAVLVVSSCRPAPVVSSALRFGSIKAGVTASPAISGLESYAVGWWETLK